MKKAFDGYAYEREQGLRLIAASEVLRAMPEFVPDGMDRGPIVTLLCPRGHRLLPITADAGQHGEAVVITPLPEHMARRSGRVTSYAEPWKHGARVCPRPGCPTLVGHDGYCDEHGGDMESIGHIRTRFTCRQPKCKWTQDVTTARLVQVYGMAVKLERREIPLGDTPPAPIGAPAV